MSREAMQMALHTLEGWANYGKWVWPESALEQAKRNTTESIDAALRQALETEQEPVAWRYKYPDGVWRFSNGERVNGSDPIKSQPLYTAPPKQWVGLTLNEAEEFYDKYTDRAELINAIDKFLEEKNT
jgi:hypothetical protein